MKVVNNIDIIKAKKNMRYIKECFNKFQENNIAIFKGKVENVLYFFKNWDVVYFADIDITIIHFRKAIEEQLKSMYPQDKYFKDEELFKMGFSKTYRDMKKTYIIDNVIIDVLFYIRYGQIEHRIKGLNYKNIIENIEK